MYCERDVPCVGISFGVERIYTILNRRSLKIKGGSATPQDFDVFIVAAGGGGLLLERMAICGQLTRAGIRAGFLRKAKPSMRSWFNAAGKAPLTVILGPDEFSAGKVRLKAPTVGDTKDRGQLVARDDVVVEVKHRLQDIYGDTGPGL